MTPLSILDLARVTLDGSARIALDNARDLAAHAEGWGYRRFWLAEHHNMPGIASAATALAIAHVAAGSHRIRVGAGGIMLPNHAPLIVAEQFGTLAQLFPGRIDLGLGRAPGTDQATLRALRRSPASADAFPQDVLELQAYFRPEAAQQRIQAVPAAGMDVPLWILGSSTYGAALAAQFGLPYAFASHFAPEQLLTALQVYRTRFKPSAACPRPYVMVAVNVIAADTDAQADYLASTQRMSFADLLRGTARYSKPPIPDMDAYWNDAERLRAQHMLACSVVGSPDTVRAGLLELRAQTQADEFIIVSDVYEHARRLHSFSLTAQCMGSGVSADISP